MILTTVEGQTKVQWEWDGIYIAWRCVGGVGRGASSFFQVVLFLKNELRFSESMMKADNSS